MKTYLYQSLIVLSLCSCSTESPDATTGSTEFLTSKPAHKMGDATTSPANPDNPYDYAGVITDRILDDYASQPDEIRSLPDIIQLVEDLLNADPATDDNLPAGYQVPAAAFIQQLLLDADLDFLSDLTAAGYSTNGKVHLQDLRTGLSSLKLTDSTYETVYNYIVEIEQDILDGHLPPDEEEALLTTTSVLRYALYNDTKRKRRDRDWEWSTANITATSTGAATSIPDAIALCVISKVYTP
ncbi:hypothetical protein [uncultured Flavobacterium sp.]|uniref:hypothetical protein n=1 Tax=uncultured Flavobacterium sp. TaxID=165435 RepID=UPI0025DACBC4|nr:hypothetical protein [uncultured Flavobacterium sp.]